MKTAPITNWVVVTTFVIDAACLWLGWQVWRIVKDQRRG